METKTFVPTADGLVEYCLEMMKVPHVYLWDGNGQYLTKELVNDLAEQYPDWYTPEKKAVRLTLADKGIRGWDCFGLIKSYIWNDYSQYNAEGYFKDIDYATRTLIEVAEEKGPVETMAEIPGLVLWKPGHVGVYIGDGKALEMTCGWHATDITHTVGGIQILPLEEGGWTHWLKCPYIQY